MSANVSYAHTSAHAVALLGLLGACALGCSRGERARQAPHDAAPTPAHQALETKSKQRPEGAASSAPPARSAGCGRPGGRSGNFTRQTTDGDGRAREYQLLVPTSYDALEPLALTFVYHGAGSTDDGAKAFGLQTAKGAASASIFVFPRGIPFQTFGVGWNDHCSGYDMPFFDHMLDELRSTYCIDETRVFAAGFSWGGDHVTTLACCRGSKVRAIAPASCSDEFSDHSNYRTYQNERCANGTTAIRFTHDPAGDSALSAKLFQTTSALYRSFNRCAATSAASAGACVAYEGCAQPFIECAPAGLGHALPPSWASDTWRFFSAFSAPPSAPAAPTSTSRDP